jgi:PAS domain S-box-containing protein
MRHNLIYSQPYLGIVYFDDDRTIVDCNDKFSEIVGYHSDYLIGHNLFNIFDDKEILVSIQKSLSGVSSLFEGCYFNRDKNKNVLLRGHFIKNPISQSEETINAGIFEDITAIKQTEHEYNLLTHSFKNISECIVITNSENLITYVNNAFVNLFGYSKDEIIGSSFQILRSLNNPRKINEDIYVSATIKNWNGVLLNVKKDNTEFPVYLSYSAIENENGEGFSHIGIIRDISSEKKLEQELISARKKAEQSDKLKSEFLGQMSHEIRTPVNVILNISNMILEDYYFEADDDRQSSFAILDSAGKRIVRTIDLILNMSDIQIGSYKTSFKTFDLFSEMYNTFFNQFKKMAEEKDLDFIWKKEALNTNISGDYYSVSQIFSNLLHNSIQFTHIGEITVLFSTNSENKLVVDFTDTGIGISEEFLPNIYNTFSQEESGHTRKYEGNGLGMALTKAYCDLNKIQIDIISKKGFGSTISLTFL